MWEMRAVVLLVCIVASAAAEGTGLAGGRLERKQDISSADGPRSKRDVEPDPFEENDVGYVTGKHVRFRWMNTSECDRQNPKLYWCVVVAPNVYKKMVYGHRDNDYDDEKSPLFMRAEDGKWYKFNNPSFQLRIGISELPNFEGEENLILGKSDFVKVEPKHSEDEMPSFGVKESIMSRMLGKKDPYDDEEESKRWYKRAPGSFEAEEAYRASGSMGFRDAVEEEEETSTLDPMLPRRSQYRVRIPKNYGINTESAPMEYE